MIALSSIAYKAWLAHMRLDWERMERKSNQVRSSFRKRRPVIWPIINWPTAERKRVQPINYLAYRDISKVSFLYPIWAYWACFAPGSTARHPFLMFSQHTVRDAPLWGTWYRTLHWWRTVGKDRRRKKPSIRRDSNPQPPDHKACALPLWRNCWSSFHWRGLDNINFWEKRSGLVTA